MEKKKSHFALVLFGAVTIIIIALVILRIALFFKPLERSTIQEVMLSRWNITLPENMELEYFVSTFGFPSDGEEYRVFKLNEEPTALLEDFNHEKSEKPENGAEYIFEWLEHGDKTVPEEWRPDWEKEYCWKYTGQFPRDDGSFKDFIYLIYFPSSMRLYTLEQML